MTRGGYHKRSGLIQDGKQLEFAMSIVLRSDFDATLVRQAARQSKDGAQARRLLALAVIYEGRAVPRRRGLAG